MRCRPRPCGYNSGQFRGGMSALSNFLVGAFDSVRRGALNAARRALPQHCELCAAASAYALVCAACTRELPRLGPTCPVCSLPTPDGQICGHCLAEPPAFAATLAAFSYAFPVDRLMHALKYRGRLALAEWCAMAILIERERCGPSPLPDRLVALPLSTERQRQRGYNQAFEIARVIAAHPAVPLLRSEARRIRATPPQASLPWSERARNVHGAFACDAPLSGLAVAVIDDVMTTGASLAELATTLRRAGAKRVENWVVARTLPP